MKPSADTPSSFYLQLSRAICCSDPMTFNLNTRKLFFLLWKWSNAGIVCVVSIYWDTHNLTGHSPGRPAVGNPAMVGLDDLKRSLTASAVLCCVVWVLKRLSPLEYSCSRSLHPWTCFLKVTQLFANSRMVSCVKLGIKTIVRLP